MAMWRFLTNHALVLIRIGRRPDSTGLEIGRAVGITERAVRKIVAELQAGGYVETERIGRRNRYRVDVLRPVRRVGERDLTVGELLAVIPEGYEAAAPGGTSAARQSGNLAPATRGGAH